MCHVLYPGKKPAGTDVVASISITLKRQEFHLAQYEGRLQFSVFLYSQTNCAHSSISHTRNDREVFLMFPPFPDRGSCILFTLPFMKLC
jgi:hypothetical protein